MNIKASQTNKQIINASEPNRDKSGSSNILASFYYSLSYPGFLIWFLILFINENYLSHFTQPSLFNLITGLESFLIAMLIMFAFYIVLDLIVKERIITISALCSVILWITFAIDLYNFAGVSVFSELTAFPIKIAEYIMYNPVLYLFLGFSVTALFISVLKYSLDLRVKAGLQLKGLNLFIALWSLLITGFYE